MHGTEKGAARGLNEGAAEVALCGGLGGVHGCGSWCGFTEPARSWGDDRRVGNGEAHVDKDAVV
jgi:hypothetical protein